MSPRVRATLKLLEKLQGSQLPIFSFLSVIAVNRKKRQDQDDQGSDRQVGGGGCRRSRQEGLVSHCLDVTGALDMET